MMNERKESTIAVLGAMDEEVRLLGQHLQDKQYIHEAGLDILMGEIDTSQSHLHVVATVAGMGMVAAGAATQFLITRFHPESILFSGIAGNISNKVDVNDVVLGGTLRYLDSDMDLIGQAYPEEKEYHSDASLIRIAEDVLREQQVNYIIGIIATGNRFIDTAEKREQARKQTSADIVEMEGAAVIHIADKNSVPALVLRAVSDNTDTEYESFHHFDISEYADTASQIIINILKKL